MAYEEVTQVVLSCMCVCGLQFINGYVPEAVFKSQCFDLNIELFELNTIYWLRILDITMMTVFARKCFKYFLISSVFKNIVRNLMTRFSCAV
jgi:hypothetical protein